MHGHQTTHRQNQTLGNAHAHTAPARGHQRVPDRGLQVPGLGRAGSSLPTWDSGTQAPAAVPTRSPMSQSGRLCQAHCCGLSQECPDPTTPLLQGDAEAITKAQQPSKVGSSQVSSESLFPLHTSVPGGHHCYPICQDGSSLRGPGFRTRSLAKETSSRGSCRDRTDWGQRARHTGSRGLVTGHPGPRHLHLCNRLTRVPRRTARSRHV